MIIIIITCRWGWVFGSGAENKRCHHPSTAPPSGDMWQRDCESQQVPEVAGRVFVGARRRTIGRTIHTGWV